MLGISDVVLSVSAAAPAAFVCGLLGGFLLSNRYRIIRRNGEKKP